MPLLPSLRPSMFDPDEAGRVLDTMTRPTAPNPAPQTAGEVLDTMTGPAAARPRTQTVTTGSGTTAYDFDAGGRLVNPAGRAVGGGGPADRMTADEIGRVMDQMFKANRSRLGPDAAASWELDPQNARLSAAYRADIARNAAEATNAQLQNLLGHRQAEISRQTAADQQANALAIEKLREQGQMDRERLRYGKEAREAATSAAAIKAFYEALAANPQMAPQIHNAFRTAGRFQPASATGGGFPGLGAPPATPPTPSGPADPLAAVTGGIAPAANFAEGQRVADAARRQQPVLDAVLEFKNALAPEEGTRFEPRRDQAERAVRGLAAYGLTDTERQQFLDMLFADQGIPDKGRLADALIRDLAKATTTAAFGVTEPGGGKRVVRGPDLPGSLGYEALPGFQIALPQTPGLGMWRGVLGGGAPGSAYRSASFGGRNVTLDVGDVTHPAMGVSQVPFGSPEHQQLLDRANTISMLLDAMQRRGYLNPAR